MFVILFNLIMGALPSSLNGVYLRTVGKVIPELTPVEMEALACRNTSETAVDEAGISDGSLVRT
jgi:hypothetical protein